MKPSIVVYEAPEDLSSIILGIQTDPARIQFNQAVTVLQSLGYEVTRYNTLDHSEKIPKTARIPSVYIEHVQVSENYPTVDEIAEKLNLDVALFQEVQRTNILTEANSKRLGLCCGVGQDVYIDPNEGEFE